MSTTVDADGNVVDLPDDDTKVETPNVSADITALKDGLKGALESIGLVASGQQSLQATIQQLADAMKAGTTKQEDLDPKVDDTDLETMSRKDLIEFIKGGVSKDMTAVLKPFIDQIKGIDSKLDTSISSITVKDFEKDHKDLMEWKVEIGDILKMGRARTVDDAYKLVRLDNPDKAKTLDKKYNPPVHKDGSNVARIGFQGFPPAKGGEGGKNQRMTAAQAAEAAWEEAIADSPGIEQFLSNTNNGSM